MLQFRVCVVVTCDDCQVEFETTGSHFADESAALAALVTESAWRVTADGRLLCEECANRRVCAARGHEWLPWRPCRYRGTRPGHIVADRGHCGWEFRLCKRCSHGEQERPGLVAKAVA